MSVAKPQNRQEFKQYMLTRLGAPVLQVNVADEQLDICIDDAFQYFNERNHFNGVENAFLTYQVDNDFRNYFKSMCVAEVEELVPAGQLDPNAVHVPGIFIQRIFQGSHFEKRIEQRTVIQKA